MLDGVWLLCEQSSWCWPAHDDAFRERGCGAARRSTTPYLDLGAGEVVGQLAWLDHLVGDGLERRYPGVRARIRREARVRVLEPFLRRRDWHWLGLDGDVHNWNPWIHGNVLVAALALLDADDPARAEVVALAIEGIDRYVAVLPQDGAIDEGYAYWWNGACRALEALDILAHATGGRLDAFDVPALRATVAFPHRMHLGGPWYLNLADGPARPPADAAVARPAPRGTARRRRGCRRPTPPRTAHGRRRRDRDRRPRPAAARHDGRRVDRRRAGIVAAPPRCRGCRRRRCCIARPSAGTAAGLTLAVKGGHNGEHHNHNDVGSFVVASDGVPVIVDAGPPDLHRADLRSRPLRDLDDAERLAQRARSSAGASSSRAPRHAARDVAVEISDEGSSLSLDLAGAYDGRRLLAPHRATRAHRADHHRRRVGCR